jgi:hypothetical protein
MPLRRSDDPPPRKIRIRIRANVELSNQRVTLEGVGEHDANEDERERLRREALMGAVDEKGDPTWFVSPRSQQRRQEQPASETMSERERFRHGAILGAVEGGDVVWSGSPREIFKPEQSSGRRERTSRTPGPRDRARCVAHQGRFPEGGGSAPRRLAQWRFVGSSDTPCERPVIAYSRAGD